MPHTIRTDLTAAVARADLPAFVAQLLANAPAELAAETLATGPDADAEWFAFCEAGVGKPIAGTFAAPPLTPAEVEEAIAQARAEGFAAGRAEREEAEEADHDAADTLDHDDSEWADRQRGYGEGDSTLGQNDAGEWVGFM